MEYIELLKKKSILKVHFSKLFREINEKSFLRLRVRKMFCYTKSLKINFLLVLQQILYVLEYLKLLEEVESADTAGDVMIC
jgi:hypothetical protein